MAILHLLFSTSLFVLVCVGVGGLLAAVLTTLDRLEPATVRITHPPTRRTGARP